MDELKTQLQAMRAHVTQLKVCNLVVCLSAVAYRMDSRIVTAPIFER